MNIKVLVMAAGASRRLGKPKQLLDFKEQKLLTHCIAQCLDSNIGEVTVILGAYADKILPELEHLPCKKLINESWSSGLGNSIAFGMNNIDTTGLDGILLVLGDQPYFSSRVLLDIQHKITASTLTCNSKYTEGSGPPVYFSKALFEELSRLDGDEGAKSIVQKHKAFVEQVLFDKGNIDIDTKEDLKHLN